MLTDNETILRNTTRLKIDPVNLPFDRSNRFADKKLKRYKNKVSLSGTENYLRLGVARLR